MNEQMLELTRIRLDGDTQPRVIVHSGIVQEYAEAMEAGVEFPPVTVVHDGATYWLVDGFHRFLAHRRLNRPQIKAEVITGELTEARWLSVAANKAHGLRRSNGDKAKAVMRALRLRPELSDHAIAEHVGVSHVMISTYRKRLIRPADTPGAGGKIYHLPNPGATDQGAGGKIYHLPDQGATRLGRDGKHYPVRAVRHCPAKPTIARTAFQPIGAGGKPARMTALNMPHDPVMGARTLIELFDTDYLRALVVFLNKHLQGIPAEA